ncbi:MAG: 16S rRNA (guanine(527)-N(7))-methyltransferase RsmG [Blastocatellia bacterium]
MSEQETQFKTALEAILADFAIADLSEKQIAQLVKHYSLMRAWNRRVNLTRIVEPCEAARLHYADSLFGGRFIIDARRILDIGSGAGFPALPLAVLRPDSEVTALEANQKKSVFLNEARDDLGLANFRVATARLESFDLTGYDLLTSRALDRAEEVLPSVIARLDAGQRFMLYCAPDLLAKINNRTGSMIEVKTHRMPQSKARLIAIFSRAG